MSKIGNAPVLIPSTVKVDMQGQNIVITGTKGTMSISLPHFITAVIDNDKLIITRKSDGKRQKASHGLYRSLLFNAVAGVQNYWSKRLEIVGTGYNVKIQGADLNFRLGFSHPVIFKAPKGIQLAVDGNNIVIVSGVDKQQVGEVAQRIKGLKKPDAYKGKGVRYEGEYIKLKPGKKAKA
jgi:large subunit ribosomal protein L6